MTTMHQNIAKNSVGSRSVAVAALLLFSSSLCWGASLGSAGAFAVLGASTVTNDGATLINGNLGLWPGTSITGLGTVSLTGTVYASGAVAQQAQIDALAAYNSFALLPFTAVLTGSDLGTVGVLSPGVYSFATSAQLTGALVLDALGDPNALFVFQIGSTLTTASNASVTVLNGGSGTGLFWQVGSSATLGSNTAFAGNILALTSITANTGASILCGRAIALNGAVTLDTNAISNNCADDGDLGSGRIDFGSSGFAQEVPEPGTVSVVSLGLITFVVYLRRKRHSISLS